MAGMLLLAHGALAAEPADSLAGQSIYREGRLPSGEPVHATVQNGVALAGAAAACVNCHRRSGLGGSEGQVNIRPIAGRLLFAPPARAGETRPAYTQATLARALREGVDPGGRALDTLMPRYALSDDDVARLHAYLEGVSATVAPGVSDREIHFATIVTPDVAEDERRAMLDVMHAFFRDKNGGTRLEARRREVGRERMYLAYRTWVLHVWALKGRPDTWRRQLEAYYRQQPVFAAIGGIGRASWQPVHAFCEEFELPCVLPDVDYPVVEKAGYYAVYFSRGVALEAEVLAEQLAKAAPRDARIAQVFRDDETGRLPAQALRQALRRRGIDTLADHPVTGDGPVAAGFWSGLLNDARPAILVVWLAAEDVASLGETGPPPSGLQAVYLSASLSASERTDLAGGWRERVRMVCLFDLPARRAQHLARMTMWLRARKVPLADERIQANTYFALTLAGDAMEHLGLNFSRDYFIERIEQMAGTSPSPSIYPRLSLGPGQRFASRGGHIVGFPHGAEPVPLSDWLVP